MLRLTSQVLQHAAEDSSHHHCIANDSSCLICMGTSSQEGSTSPGCIMASGKLMCCCICETQLHAFRTPLPVLFMRFAMQTQAAWPGLGWLLLEILSMLVGRTVWADNQQWRGWLLATVKHAPASFPAFLQVCSCKSYLHISVH